MTLDTRVYLRDPVDYREVFMKCNQLIGAHEGIRFTDDNDSIANDPGQGLCAWLIVYHRDQVEVSLDTAYGYDADGEGCGDLHARLVAQLGHWLDGKGIRWSWQNEFTGEIHEGYEGLADLGSGGAEASTWFREIVAPALGLQP